MISGLKRMEHWIEVAKTSEILPGKRKTLKVFGSSITVFNVEGRFYAIDNTCPHQGGPLGEGALEGEVVTCPWHAWKYNVRTGCAVVTPSVGTHELRVIDGRVEIGTDSDQAVVGEGTPEAEEDPVQG